jgi:hypothetical protein
VLELVLSLLNILLVCLELGLGHLVVGDLVGVDEAVRIDYFL